MDLDAITRAITTYMDEYRRPELPTLVLSPLYALFPEEENLPDLVGSRWPESWPSGASKGVYFVFGRGARLLYVGGRLSQWFRREQGSGGCRVVHPGWTEKPMYIATLPVADDMAFEAPALEEYLIQRLALPDNSVGAVINPRPDGP